jgi:SAM-dependent methyltransferase
MFREKLKNTLYKALVTPIVSKGIETRYEQYLSDKATASQFARTYLPEPLQEGWDRNAFDVGCGRGRHAAMLSQLGFHVTGMDVQPHPYWSRIRNASFLVGTVGSLSSIPNGTFDLVVCMQVLMYLIDDDAALAQMRRILKREGYLLLQVTNADNLHTVFTQQPLFEDSYLERYYRKADLYNKLEQNGFIVERLWMEKFYFPFFVSLGNIFYEFVLNDRLRAILDRWMSPRHLGLMNILARPKEEIIPAQR